MNEKDIKKIKRISKVVITMSALLVTISDIVQVRLPFQILFNLPKLAIKAHFNSKTGE